MLLKVISAVLLCLLQTTLIYAQNCATRCVRTEHCPQALSLLRTRSPTAVALLRSKSCGFIGQSPAVCCQNLSATEGPGPQSKQHPNMRLLPLNCSLNADERIVDGNETGLYEFPWMVLLSYRTRNGLEFKCGGSLINDRYVLTAAHCLVGQKLAGVRIGEHDTRTPMDCQGVEPPIICESNIQDMYVDEQILHEDYKRLPKIRNDFALLRLRTPVDFTPRNARAQSGRA